jgi:hypothetical protein
VTEFENQRNRELECKRLASDLMELASDTLSPHLKAHCIRMARLWFDRADQERTGKFPNVLNH